MYPADIFIFIVKVSTGFVVVVCCLLLSLLFVVVVCGNYRALGVDFSELAGGFRMISSGFPLIVKILILTLLSSSGSEVRTSNGSSST